MISSIEHLFYKSGHRLYSGEAVTQIEHALQTAALAEADGANAALITAALLHDLGHLVNDQGETPSERGIDDRHQYAALPFLAPAFDAEVLEPIRLHVEAKRYLCAENPSYFERLSADSRRSLVLQGGPMTAAEAAAFSAGPHSESAVRLRLWDDRAKFAGAMTPQLEYFLVIAQSVERR